MAAPAGPFADLLTMAGAIGGNTSAGEKLAYLHYRKCFTARQECPATTASDVMSYLSTMLKDSKGRLRALAQKSQTPLDKVSPASLMSYARTESDEKALRVVRTGETSRAVSRIALTIDGSKTDRVLLALAGATMKHACIADFKLVVPQDIGRGPDDFIVYFDKPLGNAEVQAAIGAIHSGVSAFLMDGVAPLGKEKLAGGIFGSDMPQATVTGTRLNFNGSHGDDRGKIVAEAVRRAARGGGDLAAELRQVLQEVGLDPANPARRLVTAPSAPASSPSPAVASSSPSPSAPPTGAGAPVPHG